MKTLTLTMALLLSSPAAFAADAAMKADAAKPVMMVATPDFAKTVMSSNMFEVKSSEMAETKAEAADVKEFAAAMIKDHTKADEDLKAALGGEGSKVPAEIAPKHAAMLKQLEAANGADFQTLYIDMQAQAHMEAVALFRTYAGSGDNPAVMSFAKETLPVLEGHMMHVKGLVKAH
jgi:putative membrane protein